MSRRFLLFFFVSLSIAACGGSSMPDAGADTGVADADTDAALDAGRDAGPPRVDGGPMPTFDTSTTYGAPPLDCGDAGVARRVGRDLGAQRNFALSVLHYNVQYVAGGLDGFFIGSVEPFDGWTDDRVQDAIVTQSLAPVLDLLDAHPTWTISIEMQGYMEEVMLARHRDVAQHLADLVRGGQVELVSFHYADQLFLAYPRHHMEESRTLNLATWASGCLEPSGPVFTQEGQYGEGMADLLAAGGVTDATLLLPKNLFSYFHGEGAVAPYYTVRGVPVVIAGRGVDDAASGFHSAWVYMNDAELLATGGVNPYVPDAFVVHPDAVADFEMQLETLEAGGYVIAGVSDWVATLQGAGVAAPDLPATPDGTWQPDDTTNVARWMGDAALYADGERDNSVLAGNGDAGRMVLAAESVCGADPDVPRAWRDLLLGEVSDATGWNPIPGEVFYGQAQAQLAKTRARAAAIRCAAASGTTPPFVVDTATGTLSAPTTPAMVDDPAPPFAVTPSAADRTFTSRWQIASGVTDDHVLVVDFPTAPRRIAAQLTVPWNAASLRTTPALLDGSAGVDVPFSALTIPHGAAIAIDDGPFGLDDDVWLVLDTASVALGARLDTAAHTVTFRDESLPATSTATWTLHVVTGSHDRAVAVADALNIHPHVLVTAP